MSSAAGLPLTPARPVARPKLRPIALPTEHGGWGFLFEPIVLGLAVAPSVGGALIAAAFVFGFLTRQPLKLALQDALRGKVYPRTRWSWIFAVGYAVLGLAALGGAIALAGGSILVPVVLVGPLGIVQIVHDAQNRSRSLLAEAGGGVAMASSAAAIAIAGGFPLVAALALSGIVVARGIPTIVYVRALLTRAHGGVAANWPPLALHAAAVLLAALFAPPLAVAATFVLLLRAAWGLTHPVPPARRVGWTEIVWGVVTVALAIAGWRTR